jgi:Na+:H+ antiporter, NhaB family
MTQSNYAGAFYANFLGHAPDWYKITIIGFLIVNPILDLTAGDFVTGWVLIAEFIFCLAMALKCYPLQPGGLLAIEAVLLGLTTAEGVYKETVANFSVLLLLIFMVAGIYFMKELLLFAFTKVLLKVRSKIAVSLIFCFLSALLSAFLDALTVVAVVITVAQGFYVVYLEIASGRAPQRSDDRLGSSDVGANLDHEDLDNFRGFLRDIMMHAAVGTALGGVCTLVGEPQNLLIGQLAGWNFAEFFTRMAPVTMPVLVVGLMTCFLVEKFRVFGFGTPLPDDVRKVLKVHEQEENAKRSDRDRARLIVQAIAALILFVALGLHLTEVGIIGLTIIVLQTAFNGVTDEHRIGQAFQEALPFAALLVVFFAVVAVIHEQHLFSPITESALALEGKNQLVAFYLANGVLSMISDNVFVATVYISDVFKSLQRGAITREQFDLLAVTINAGTNIPSVATPNGQAAFLFLLTSALAPLIRLSYGRMVWMSLPYTITMSSTGLAAIYFFL